MAQGKRFKQAIIHVGTERTGSTSIQSTIYQHRAYLASQGVLVPMSLLRSYENLAGTANHILAVMAYADDEQFPTDLVPDDIASLKLSNAEIQDRILADMAAEFAATDPRISTLLISAEHIHSRLNTVQGIARMKDGLSQYVETFKIVVFLRPQVEMAVSLGNLALRRGVTELRLIPKFDDTGGWDRVLGIRRGYFDLHAMMQRLATVFGQNAIRPFLYESCDTFDSCGILFGELGVPLPAATNSRRENASIDRDAQSVILAINCGIDRIWPQQREIFLERVDRLLVAHCRGEGIRPSRGEAWFFMLGFKDGNEALRASYFPESEALFKTRLDEYPIEVERLDEMSPAALVLLELLIELANVPLPPS